MSTKENKQVACWKSIRVFIILVMVGFALLKPGAAQSGQPFRFRDGFETPSGWGIFEEIVGGSSCYGTDIGEVARATDVASDGAHSLRVWANTTLSSKSNHVIAQKQVSNSGQTGRLRYQLVAYIAPETATSGEAGPEFSMQNTRKISPGQFRTATAGIQYRANPFSPLHKSWGIWAEVAPGQAAWQTFMTTDALVPGAWYFMAVEADYTTNRYVRFWLRGPGIHLSRDLSAYQIAQEAKFNEQALWLTLESENLYNNCGAAESYQYKVYYDDVILRQSAANGIHETND